jgi:hypothetical protein
LIEIQETKDYQALAASLVRIILKIFMIFLPLRKSFKICFDPSTCMRNKRILFRIYLNLQWENILVFKIFLNPGRILEENVSLTDSSGL